MPTKKTTSRSLPLAFVLMAILAVLLTSSQGHAQTIPSDAQVTCSVTSQQFDGWFATGNPSLNGVAKPSDSVNFQGLENCNFYQWAQQMFLWVTSPADYCGSGAHVLDTPVFFQVSNELSSQRSFVPQKCSPEGGIHRTFSLRAAQVGPHKLPVIMDKSGRLLEVESPPKGPHGRPLLFSSSGIAVEVERVVLEKEKEPVFLDKNGKKISSGRPILQIHLPPKPSNKIPVVQKFMIGRRPIFLDAYGGLVDIDEGQAESGGVLMAQTGSLVYYAIMVNDVYAYFRTVTPSGGGAVAFPTSAAMLAPAGAFAAQHGVTFSDPNALVVELKTSWVEASTLPDSGSYVTTIATIPTYDTTSPNQWTPNGAKTVRMALVGMNVVGSVAGHAEMVWATFEHFGNTPLEEYEYKSTSATQPVTVRRNTAGAWLFSKTNSHGPFNCMLMIQQGDNIVPNPDSLCGAPGFTPSDTLRDFPWGSSSLLSNPYNPSATDSNTDILSINNSVHGMLLSGDVRGNYYLAGATWSSFGLALNSDLSLQAGTNLLSNSTMETYQQGSNCFSCHTSGPLSNDIFAPATTDVSHIFSELKPLPFGYLTVHVSTVAGVPPPTHKIVVTVTNSGTTFPVVGATVRVSSGGQTISGTTSGAGTVTLSYPRCFIVGQGPTVLTVPCNGSVEASGLGSVTFFAP